MPDSTLRDRALPNLPARDLDATETFYAGFGFERGRSLDDAASYETMKERLKVSIERYFRPEFLNRLDDVIVFHALNREDLKRIVDIELSKVRGRLRDRGLELVLTDEAKEYIIDKGYNPDYGARPLRRAIENMVEDPLSEEILRGSFKGMDTLTVRVELSQDMRYADRDTVAGELQHHIKSYIGVSSRIEVVAPYEIERVTVGKAKRVVDRRPKA